jgi:hypothetical protein
MSGGVSVILSDLQRADEYSARHPHVISFDQIASGERSRSPVPAFFFGEFPAFLSRTLFSELDVGAVGCYNIRQGRVTSDGVVLHRKTALWTNAFNHPDYHVRMIVEPSGWNRGALPVRYVPGRAAVIHGPGYAVYGHWLVDFLPRLHLLALAGHDLSQARFVLPADLPGFAREFLQMAGIPSGNILFHDHDREQLLFDELIVPTVLRTASRLHPLFRAASDFWVTRAGIPPAPALPTGRVFISRGGVASGRFLSNRRALEGIAADEGFEIVRPETMPIREQIALFRRASHVIGEYGSGLHGTIFGPEEQSALVLRGTSIAPGFVQSGLAAAFGHTLGYVFGPSDAQAIDYAFTVEEQDFRLGLACLGLGTRAGQSPTRLALDEAGPAPAAPADSQVILLRTHFVDEQIRAMAARLRRETGWRVALVLDCTRNEAEVAESDEVIRLTRSLFEELGVLLVADASWRCGDYAFYAARRHFPDAAFFWMIEPDLRLNFSNWGTFFHSFDATEDADLLVTHLAQAEDHHAWKRTMAPFSQRPITCMYPFLRVSARAVDVMHKGRRALTQRFLNEALPDGTMRSHADWPNDEIFTATTLQERGLICRDINSEERQFYDALSFSFAHLISARRLDRSPPDGKLHHPVEHGTEYMRKLRGRFEHIRNHGGPAQFIRDLFDRDELYEDVRLECGAEESAVFKRDVGEAIVRLTPSHTE